MYCRTIERSGTSAYIKGMCNMDIINGLSKSYSDIQHKSSLSPAAKQQCFQLLVEIEAYLNQPAMALNSKWYVDAINSLTSAAVEDETFGKESRIFTEKLYGEFDDVPTIKASITKLFLALSGKLVVI